MKIKSNPNTIENTLIQISEALIKQKATLACAESCTGGLIAKTITDIAGSSRWFDSGFITYSNSAKERMLGVSNALVTEKGAVSQEVAKAMAQGALERSDANYAVAVTGIAGPEGGSDNKPIGTVWLAWASKQRCEAELQQFNGEKREDIREQALVCALEGMLKRI